MKPSNNIPWDYITLSSLMSSVREDLKLYDEANLINENNVIKIIAECNSKLGERIYKSKAAYIDVKDGYADIPIDLYKIENIFAVADCKAPISSGGINAHNQVLYTDRNSPAYVTADKIIPIAKITTSKPIGCDDCNNCGTCSNCTDYCVSALEKEDIYDTYKRLIPLSLSEKVMSSCTDYFPGHNWRGQYSVDLQEGRFKLGFNTGKIFLSWLGNLISDDGEIMIPFHPRLNNYYEYSVKEKILMDIFINSEADVEKKLQFVSKLKSEAYYDAFNYLQTAKAGQWSKMQKQRKIEYFNKWYSAF